MLLEVDIDRFHGGRWHRGNKTRQVSGRYRIICNMSSDNLCRELEELCGWFIVGHGFPLFRKSAGSELPRV